MMTNSMQVLECGSTYTIKTPSLDTVRLTIDNSTPEETYVNISCNRVSCNFVANLSGYETSNYLLKATPEKLLDLLFPSHALWEFDSEAGTKAISELVSSLLNSEEKIEDFWDEHQYSLSIAKTREEYARWISSNIEGYHEYDGFELMSFRRYTQEAELISAVALPLIREAIQHGLVSF